MIALLLGFATSFARAQEPAAPAAGSPAAFGEAALVEERVAVPAGSQVRDRPHLRAPAVATVDAASELPLLERRGGWARVRLGARKGWVLLEPGLGGGAAWATEAGQADPVLLAKASSRLRRSSGAGAAAARLGPWRLETDLDPHAHVDLLAFLDRLAAQVPALHRERFGFAEEEASPAGIGTETVVLFAREADYRSFAERDVAIAGLDEGGFAGFGIAALYREGRTREELASLLVHELTHLENARRFGPATPPWLEEGLASDLGYSEVGLGGRLVAGTLGGRSRARGRWLARDPAVPGRGQAAALEISVTASGARAALERVQAALRAGNLPSLGTLTGLDGRAMSDPAARDLLYAESAFFVRFLLDPAEGRADAFRRFLAAFAAGGPADAAALLAELGESWETLEAAFHRWVLDER